MKFTTVPRTLSSVTSQVQLSPILILLTVINRKGKKPTSCYAVEVCDLGQLTPNLLSNGGMDGKAGAELMKWITSPSSLSPLQGAVTLGHYNMCKHLVEEGAVLNSESIILPPLCIALEKAHCEIAHLLLKAGADVNLAFKDSLPMSFALNNETCTVQIVKEIIDAGFPKNGIVHRSSQSTTLHSAVRKNHLSIVKYLCSLKVDTNVRDQRGRSPLHYAAQNSNSAMVKLLAMNGASVDCECADHFTPLLYAIGEGNCEMLQLLISLGADIHYVNRSKPCPLMPLHFATISYQFKIVQLLLENGADVNKVAPVTEEIALHVAAGADNRNVQQKKIALDCIVQLLVKKGSDLTARHKHGLTPLQVAIIAKNLSVAKILLINGSEINNGFQENDDKCFTTFHIVAKSFDTELIQLCFDYGADCNARNDEGLYPCHFALLTSTLHIITHNSDCTISFNACQNESEQLSVLKLFWKHGFPYDLTLKIKWWDTNIPPKIASLIQKQKMLFNGLKTQQLKMIQKAIAQGAEVKCSSTEIPFPLHYIASKGNEWIMKIFVCRGVSVNSLNKSGETPLHVAAKAGNVNCCRLLLDYGASYNYKSPKCSKTPLEIARENGHYEVVTLLTRVNKYFKTLKKGHFKKLKPDMKIFCSVMNCSNRNGITLLGRAVELGMQDVAERLMKLRLQMATSF